MGNCHKWDATETSKLNFLLLCICCIFLLRAKNINYVHTCYWLRQKLFSCTKVIPSLNTQSCNRWPLCSTFFWMYWPSCPNGPATEILYHQKPLNSQYFWNWTNANPMKIFSSGGPAKNFHGVGIGPLSKILAVNAGLAYLFIIRIVYCLAFFFCLIVAFCW